MHCPEVADCRNCVVEIRQELAALFISTPNFIATPCSNKPGDVLQTKGANSIQARILKQEMSEIDRVTFLPPQNFQEAEERVKVFRGKVCRRLGRLQRLIKKIEDDARVEEPQEDLMNFLKESYNDLDCFKHCLSTWWRSTERRFWQLRRASLISQCAPGDEEADEMNHLDQTQLMMESELNRMQEATTILGTSSRLIAETGQTFAQYARALRGASKLLGKLKRRSEDDSRYLYGAFVFFLGCCLYVAFKRLGVTFLLFKLLRMCWAFVLAIAQPILRPFLQQLNLAVSDDMS